MKSLLPVLIFDIDNVDEIYEARRFVETGIVTLAARNRNEKDLALLRQDIQWMDQALIELKTEDFTQRDHEFHYHLAEISRNKVLFNTLNTLMDLLQLYRQHSIHTLDHMRTSNERHHMIYDAINRQDEQCAGQIMGDHILSCKLQVIASLDPDEEPEPGILKIV